jgi:CHAT domain-containing protein
LLLGRNEPYESNDKSILLALGNPKIENSEPRYVDPLKRAMQREIDDVNVWALPGAEEEVEAIARVMGSPTSVFTGQDASKDTFMKMAPNAKIIHIATHARLDGQSPLNSYLQLARIGSDKMEGKLQATDILSMDVSAELVVLSGCNTGSILPSGSSQSLVRAFVAAGADAVVASLWNVDDAVAPTVVTSFYKYLRDGERKSRALQLAKLDLIRQGKKDPFFWAGYILIGDPAPLSAPSSNQDAGIRGSAEVILIISTMLLGVVVVLGLWRIREARKKGQKV